jgi:protein SCO1
MISCFLLALTVAAQPTSRLAIIHDAPDFSLITQDGKEASKADLQGKVTFVGFIFTTCNGTCPATTHRMSSIQQELKSRGLNKNGDVQLISITLDPARDKPDALKNYMRLYDIDSANWRFLTGPVENVNKVVADWGMWAKPAANGQLDHPSRVYLLDTLGRIREIYNLTYLKPGWVCDDIELLLKEGALPKSGLSPLEPARGASAPASTPRKSNRERARHGISQRPG